MLICAIDKEELNRLRTEAIEYLWLTDSNVAVKFINSSSGHLMFGISIYNADQEEWYQDDHGEILMWGTSKEAKEELMDHFLPNLGYKVLRNKTKVFQQLLHA